METSEERPYDWASEWDGTVDVTVLARCDNLEHAQLIASECEEVIGRFNAEFLETIIEPTE